MLASVLRLVVAGWVLLALGRAARSAWAHRGLVLTVWSRIGVRHVAGATGLVILVVAVASALVSHVPGMDLGLGRLLGTSSNAVFAPLEQAVAHRGPAPTTGPDWGLAVLATSFLLPLLVLLPWLAFVEEEVFRAGLEDSSVVGEVGRALLFGLAHLVVLVPLGAALAVGASGYAYGRAYRRRHAVSDGTEVPPTVLRSYRPGRRAVAAAARARTPEGMLAAGAVGIADRTPERRQAEAVLVSAVWHTTFNSLIVLALWAVFVHAAVTA